MHNRITGLEPSDGIGEAARSGGQTGGPPDESNGSRSPDVLFRPDGRKYREGGRPRAPGRGGGGNIVCCRRCSRQGSSECWTGTRTISLWPPRPRRAFPSVNVPACGGARGVLPVSFFERANQSYFNSVTVSDRPGSGSGSTASPTMPLGPPRCFEKYFTTPGNTGFQAWDTEFGRIGVGICWDQWFPGVRQMHGAEGSGTAVLSNGDRDRMPRPLAGRHAGPCGCEHGSVGGVEPGRAGSGPFGTTDFWGGSFIADEKGAIAGKASADRDGFIAATFDLAAIRQQRPIGACSGTGARTCTGPC